MAPSASKLKKLKAALDCCVVDVQEYSADPHAIAGGCPQPLGKVLPRAVEAHREGRAWRVCDHVSDTGARGFLTRFRYVQEGQC